jgi:pimeloyl-ACP methyl ester carboxylesterase
MPYVAGFALVIILLLVGSFIFISNVEYTHNRQRQPYQSVFDYKGSKISYRVLGKGQSVILLHGSMVGDPWDGLNTVGFEDTLAQHFKVYVPEMPGFGASDAVAGEIHNTDLFADCLCQFVEKEGLKNTPIVSLSLGTIITVKSAARGCLKGQLILVGMPGRVSGWMYNLTEYLPLRLKRYLASTSWGKRKLIIPILQENIGSFGKEIEDLLFDELSETDPRAVVDTNYKKEIETELKQAFQQIDNEVIFVYGEKDVEKGTVKDFVDSYIEIPGAEHNIFRTNPEETLDILQQLLTPKVDS